MNCTQDDALAQLRTRHPQWGWCASKRGVVQGELTDEAICAIHPVSAGGWCATVTVWTGADWADHEGQAADVVKAFEAARRAAGLEVTR